MTPDDRSRLTPQQKAKIWQRVLLQAYPKLALDLILFADKIEPYVWQVMEAVEEAFTLGQSTPSAEVDRICDEPIGYRPITAQDVANAFASGQHRQREQDAQLCEAEMVSAESAAVVEEDRAYNQACRDCAAAIRAQGAPSHD